MNQVRHHTIAEEDDGLRIDRWFRRHVPELGHGRLERLLRTGQVRLDGKRVRAGDRVATGQVVRVPPLGEAATAQERPASRPKPAAADPAQAADLAARVLYRDADLLVIDKPAGLAVQGGSGTTVHLDGLLAALQFEAAEPPRLVHRLDRDTSGVLVLARHRAAARTLTAAFRSKQTRKLYWAAVVGRPHPAQGRVDQPLAKRRGGSGQEKMAADGADGEPAVTLYRTIDHAQKTASWLALLPLTGRTHQLRAHCAALGTPILGDGKYGGAGAFLTGVDLPRRMHLHARRIVIPHPDPKRPPVDVTAELPAHMRTTWSLLGFADAEGDAGELF
ncbi:MAG: RluA family pseudouridine synthase [Rhodospirillaceae bacterium]|nr:RluA family pseudouridine synthase [Rhodospirillaceae bacterium]